MANVNLGKSFKKENSIISPVDSRIRLNKIETDEEYYGDIRLDLQTNVLKERPLNAKESTKDLQKIINDESVVTSLKNIFNSFVGSRLLNPEISFDIKQYLFEPLTQTKAWFLGYDIYSLIPKWEPRVSVKNVEVILNIDESCYVIKLSTTIPSLGKDLNFGVLLNTNGFEIVG